MRFLWIFRKKISKTFHTEWSKRRNCVPNERNSTDIYWTFYASRKFVTKNTPPRTIDSPPNRKSKRNKFNKRAKKKKRQKKAKHQKNQTKFSFKILSQTKQIYAFVRTDDNWNKKRPSIRANQRRKPGKLRNVGKCKETACYQTVENHRKNKTNQKSPEKDERKNAETIEKTEVRKNRRFLCKNRRF